MVDHTFEPAEIAMFSDDVQIEETPRTERAEYANFKTEEYRKQVFSMFGGEAIQISAMDDNTFHCTVTVQVSKTFFGWVAGSCGKVHIQSPESVISGFHDFIEQIKNAY